MMKQLLIIVVGLGLSGQAIANDKVEFSSLSSDAYSSASQSVVQLLCHNTLNDTYFLSRAVVLDLPRHDLPFDILLTARHAVMDNDGTRQCHVRGQGPDGGQVSTIARSFEGAQFSQDFSNDWAVIQTAGRLSDDLVRARAVTYDGAENGDLSLVLKASELTPCAITQAPEDFDTSTLIFHDCHTRPGMSGSPMMSMIGDQPYVVGVHVGYLTMMNEDFRRYGVARRLNGDFLDALVKLTSDYSFK